jgi:signal transduction histidine kinase
VEVVLVTGYGSMDDALEALRLGAYDFLLKPVRLARLELLVRHCEERIRFSKDNRELREVVERLRELSAQKEKFIALANHEIRTPTTVASGFVALLADRAESLPEDIRRLVLGADQAMRRLKEVVEDLGDLGLAQTGRLHLQLTPRPLSEYAEAVGEVCGMYGSLRILTIRSKCAADPSLRIVADRRKLMRAVGGLIQNAVKYTEDGGQVDVCLRVDDDGALVFEIADTGVGVPEEERQKIFEPFYEAADVRYHRTSRYEFGGGGLGVGLPVARAIAEAHGGSVEYHPRGGKGSVFSLRVPIAGPTGSA